VLDSAERFLRTLARSAHRHSAATFAAAATAAAAAGAAAAPIELEDPDNVKAWCEHGVGIFLLCVAGGASSEDGGNVGAAEVCSPAVVDILKSQLATKCCMLFVLCCMSQDCRANVLHKVQRTCSIFCLVELTM